jgi:hypothetical protein
MVKSPQNGRRLNTPWWSEKLELAQRLRRGQPVQVIDHQPDPAPSAFRTLAL